MSDFKVGDEVYKTNGLGGWSSTVYKVLYIHHTDPNRKWYVVAYMGDIPTAHYAKDLKKKQNIKEQYFYVNGKDYSINIVDGVPDWSTVK